MAAGLLVGPFFPASNVLFYVGTFIGERLLYFPSGKQRTWHLIVPLSTKFTVQLLLEATDQLPRSTLIPSAPPPPPCTSTVGFCLLLAEPLAAALRPLLPQPASSGSSNSGAVPIRAQRGRAVGTALLLAGLLGFYAVRTVVRNSDWWDEERLFRAAQKASRCWMSWF